MLARSFECGAPVNAVSRHHADIPYGTTAVCGAVCGGAWCKCTTELRALVLSRSSPQSASLPTEYRSTIQDGRTGGCPAARPAPGTGVCRNPQASGADLTTVVTYAAAAADGSSGSGTGTLFARSEKAVDLLGAATEWRSARRVEGVALRPSGRKGREGGLRD